MGQVAKMTFSVLMIVMVAAVGFAAGLLWSTRAAAETVKESAVEADREIARKKKVRYRKKTKLDFDGMNLEGEMKNPGEFYFQHRPPEKFNSLVKRRKNFHREMLRDVVLSK